MDVKKTVVFALGAIVELAVGMIFYDYHCQTRTIEMQDTIIKEMGGNVIKG